MDTWLSKEHQRRLRSDCANAQSDLRFRWAHMSGGTFSSAPLICLFTICQCKCKFPVRTGGHLLWSKVNNDGPDQIAHVHSRADWSRSSLSANSSSDFVRGQWSRRNILSGSLAELCTSIINDLTLWPYLLIIYLHILLTFPSECVVSPICVHYACAFSIIFWQDGCFSLFLCLPIYLFNGLNQQTTSCWHLFLFFPENRI